MSVDLNTWAEPFPTISQSTVKDIWAESTEEIHKDLYMKLSTQAEQIVALTNLCEKFKSQIDEMSSLKGDIGAEIISLKGDIGAEIISLKGDIGAEIISLKGDIGCEMIALKGDINCEVNSLKAEIETLKRIQLEMKTEMSSLLSGDFYIHAGGSPHGKISGGNGSSVSILSQDHMINCFTGYDVAADGKVKCLKSYGRDDGYPLKQRWSFERATDKLINHPDGGLMSIPLNKSKVPV